MGGEFGVIPGVRLLQHGAIKNGGAKGAAVYLLGLTGLNLSARPAYPTFW